MTYLIVGGVALIASGLTLFSGFGLGTLLLPAFALFYPIEIAVGATAAVHLLNNLFKLALVGRDADLGVVLRFGLPGLVAAFGGARVLALLTGLPEVYRYELFGSVHTVTPVDLVIAVLIAGFAVAELMPSRERRGFGRAWLPLGGAISGFFGGLSGHQGAMRSVFLLNCGLSKRAYIGTGVACAVLVDLARLAVYAKAFSLGAPSGNGEIWGPLSFAAAAALAGAWIGVRMIDKVTLTAVQRLVGVLLLALAVGLASGLL